MQGIQIKNMYPLTPMQEGMLFHSLLEKNDKAYFQQAIFNINGSLDIELFNESFNALLERYDILRTVFISEQVEQPLQVVLKERKMTVEFQDLSSMDRVSQNSCIEDYAKKDMEKGFDLSKDVLMRVSLLKLGINVHKVIWSFHHIIMDGWCLAILIKDYFLIYEALKSKNKPLLEPVYSYGSYVEWLMKRDRNEALEYWKRYLADYEEQASIPRKSKLGEMNGYEKVDISFKLDTELTSLLEKMAIENNTTLSAIMQAAWGVLIGIYNNTNDVVFGAVVSGRPPEVYGIETMVGLFINTVPVRVTFSKDSSFLDILKAIYIDAIKSKKYEYFSLAEIQSGSNLKNALVDSIMVFENYPLESELGNSIDIKECSLSLDNVKIFEQTNYDFNIIIRPGKNVEVCFCFNKSVYDEALVNRIIGHFNVILFSVAKDPEVHIDDINILSVEEKNEILHKFNKEIKFNYEKPIHKIFEEKVALFSDRPALVFRDRKLTYGELNEKANKLAYTLKNNGVKSDKTVALLTERSFEMITGILGVLKAGGAYIPIDTDYPADRIKYILEDSNTDILLTKKCYMKGIHFDGLVIDLEDEDSLDDCKDNPCFESSMNNLAYVIYTSGSTGKPKGVMVEHKGVANIIDFLQSRYPLNQNDTYLLKTTYTFDVSVAEIFGWFLGGGRLAILDQGDEKIPKAIIKAIDRFGITHINFVPSMFGVFMDLLEDEDIPSLTNLKYVFVAGEALPSNLIHKFYSITDNIKLENLYGPTEATIYATCYSLGKDNCYKSVPIGKPVDNLNAYILGKNDSLKPVGVPGELCVSGIGVARGYLNKQQLTNEKFVKDPFRENEMMYRTGDLVKWMKDGNIEFLGRIDHQVKIRGFRIELGEIENRLIENPSIKEAVVIAKQEKSGNASYLCAYIVAENKVDISVLKEYLKEKLPEYMLPSYFVYLEKMPLNFNGKISRSELPDPELNIDDSGVFQPPEGEYEQKLALIWKDVLQVDRIDRNDDFFELGGHSLKATILASRVHKNFGAEMPLKDIFKNSSLKDMSSLIKIAKKNSFHAITPCEKKEYYASTSVQKRIFALSNLDGAEASYNMPSAALIDGSLELDKLNEVLNKLVDRHEALRTSFKYIDGELVQHIAQNIDFKHDYIKIPEKYKAMREEHLLEELANDYLIPFDLEKAPLLNVSVFELNFNRYFILFNMHHIVSDGTSVAILLKEFVRLYNGDVLEPLKVQYKDYTSWYGKFINDISERSEFKKQEKFWSKVLGGELPVLDMPQDFARNSSQSFEGDTASIKIDKELTAKLKNLAGNTGTTLYQVMFAAYNILLHKYTGQNDIIVGTPVSGRNHADLENIVGMFVNTLALRNSIEREKSFISILEEIKSSTLDAFDNQDYPLENILSTLDIKKNSGRNPLFDTIFTLQNIDSVSIESKGMKFIPYKLQSKTAKFDMTFTISEEKYEMELDVEFCIKLYRSETIKRLMVHYLTILDKITKNPEMKIGQIDIIPNEERAFILNDFNDTSGNFENDKTIIELFEEQVENNPNNVCLVYDDKTMTYKELDREANRLAHVLIDKGVKQNSIVAVVFERSFEMIIGMFGVLKAGGAFLPIDPDYPLERIEYIINDSNSYLILTKAYIADRLQYKDKILCLDEKALLVDDTSSLGRISSRNDLAYVIYTSGTTGRPKGVMIETGSMADTVKYRRDEYKMIPEDRVIQVFSYSFDGFITSFFTPVIAGASSYILKDDEARNPISIKNYIAKYKITHYFSVPVLYNEVLECMTYDEARSLKIVTLGGDRVSQELIKKSKDKNQGIEIVNEYGPTEGSVNVTICRDLKPEGKILIGKPIARTKIYILDKYNNLQPIGVPGELCIAGSRLARGYMNNTLLTEEKFVKNPYSVVESDMRLYKTGDLARWMPDGNIEFLGRNDFQVKIRGFRIELSEIENSILEYEGIVEAVVIDLNDERGSKYLCAYITTNSDVDLKMLKDNLNRRLPYYMVPPYIMVLDKMPVTPNGKINRKMLPEPDRRSMSESLYVAPRNAIEAELAGVWEDVLAVGRVSINDNFFDLGGDSIKAIQISARIHQLGMTLEIKDIMTYPTIKELSIYVKNTKREISQEVVKGKVSLTPIQRWFFQQKFTDMNHFNQSVVIFKEHGFDVEILSKAFDKVVEHHDVLRMVYEIKQDEISQYNRGIEAELYSLEIFNIHEDDAEKQIENEASKIQESISLEKGPLVKLGLFKTGNGDYLVVIIHHLVIDGVSWRILLEDFSKSYMQALDGKDLKLAYKTNSFMDWAERLECYGKSKRVLKEAKYWMAIKDADIAKLPKDKEVNEDRYMDSESIQIYLDCDKTRKLLMDVNKAYNTEINHILLSALGLAIKNWTRRDKILINLEGHGREELFNDIDINRTIGWFTAMYPVVLDIATDSVGQCIRGVKETLRRVPSNGIGYGILRYLGEVSNENDIKPEISFNYLGQFESQFDNGAFSIVNIKHGDDIGSNIYRTCAIDFSGAVVNGELGITITYNRNQYIKDTIKQLIECYEEKLIEIIEHCAAINTTVVSPSDFGNKTIAIDELDRIINDLAKRSFKLQDIYPLSNMQDGLLFHSIIDKNSNAYFNQLSLDIEGKLDLECLRKSFDILINRNDVLKTIFVYEDIRKPQQVVLRDINNRIYYEDLTVYPYDERIIIAEDFKKADCKRGFELSKEILVRISVLKMTDSLYKLIWSHHHILMDGWCLDVLIDEFFNIYKSLRNNNPLDLPAINPYRNYIHWLYDQDEEQAKKYWSSYLDEYQIQAVVPKKTNSIINDKYKFEKQSFFLDRNMTKALEDIAKANQVTLNTVFQAVWGILLQKYNYTDDVVFGSVVSGRPAQLKGIEKMIGLFINTVPVRVKCKAEDSFAKLLRKLQTSENESRNYDYLSLASIQACSELRSNLINNIIAFENTFNEQKDKAQDTNSDMGFSVVNSEMFEQTSYDFDITVGPGEELYVKFSYNANVYDGSFVSKIEGHIKKIVSEVINNPDACLRSIEIVTNEEKKELLESFNRSKDYVFNRSVHTYLEEYAEKNPQETAIIFDSEVTYSALNQKANQIAHYLLGLELYKEDIVAVLLQRTPLIMETVLGIWKAGGAYVPIDTEYPFARKKAILEESGARYVITLSSFVDDEIINSFGDKLIILDECDEKIKRCSKVNPGIHIPMESLAYSIYTSGSTGTPKGAMIEHIGLMNHIYSMLDDLKLGNEQLVFAQNSSHCFDISVWQFFASLTVGGKTAIYPNSLVMEVGKFIKRIIKDKVKILEVVPSYLAAMMDYIEDNNVVLEDLQYLMITGETAKPSIVRRWFELCPEIKMVNAYGPAEAADDISHYIMDKAPEREIIPVGSPINNMNIYILGKDMELCPVGVAGEICVSGTGVGRGYLNNPEKTSEVFMIDPFIKDRNVRMYRTGDLGRWLPCGNIEFFGRKDYQVKVRGFRIELGEIESKLTDYMGVREAVVMDLKDKKDNTYLCAYVTCDGEIDSSILKTYLLSQLPDYMVPSNIIIMKELPLTPNGKIDRKLLPEPNDNDTSYENYTPPMGKVEEALAEIWKEVLDIEIVSIEDDFFERGGHSLKATSLVTKIHKSLSVEVPIKEIFRLRTFREQADFIKGAKVNSYASIKPVGEMDFYKVSSAQKRMYIVNQVEGDSTNYNVPEITLIEGDLDVKRLENAINTMVKRHEILRTSFELIDGEPVQIVHKDFNFVLDYTQHISGKDNDENTLEKVMLDFVKPFELGKLPLFRAKVIKLSDKKYALLIDIHHIISDGQTMSIMVKEFSSLYGGRLVDDLKIQYKDYAVWQNELLKSETIKKQQEYWLSVYSGEIPVINFPHFRASDSIDVKGETLSFEIYSDITEKLNNIAGETGTTMYMILLAAFNVLLSKYTGQQDIVIGTPIAGRHQPDLEGIIGMFVNTIAIRNRPRASKNFREFLNEIRENSLNAYENQDYQFEELVNKLGIPLSIGRNPLFDVVFVMQNMDFSVVEIEGLSFIPYKAENKTAKFFLTLMAVEEEGKIKCAFEYKTSIFTKESVLEIIEAYRKVLDMISINLDLKIGDMELFETVAKEEAVIADDIEFDF